MEKKEISDFASAKEAFLENAVHNSESEEDSGDNSLNHEKTVVGENKENENLTQDNQPSQKEDNAEVMLGRMTEALNSAIEQVRERNERIAELERLINEQNVAAENAAKTYAAEPLPPTLDMSDYEYMSEDERNNRIAEHNNAVMQFMQSQREGIEKTIMDKLQPYITKADEAEKSSVEAEVIRNMSNSDLEGFAQMLPDIRAVIASNPAIAGIEDIEKKYLDGFLLASGLKYLKEKKDGKLKRLSDEELSKVQAEDFIKLYSDNPEFQKAIAKLNVDAVEKNKDIPVFSANGDAGNAALNIEEKPKNFAQASSIFKNFLKK